MLAIRLQRTGRRNLSSFRVVVQDSRLSPKSGKYVALLGSYDPHTKKSTIDKEKAKFYLDNGAQPSSRITVILKNEGLKLPDWVQISTKKSKTLKNAEKLRKNRPAEEAVIEKPAEPEAEAKEESAENTAEEKPTEVEQSEPAAEDKPANDKAETEQEKPAEETEPTDTKSE